MLNSQKGNGVEKCYRTLLVSALMCACVSLRREMELLLRPPTTAISVLKFCSCSSFCKQLGCEETWEKKSFSSAKSDPYSRRR